MKLKNNFFFNIRILLITISFILFNNCANSVVSDSKINIQLFKTSFDVVEKELIVNGDIPLHVIELTQYWFENKVKINGLEGKIIFTIHDYKQNISNIDNGKRVDMSLKFEALIKKETLSHVKTIKGEINSYGSLTGSFSLDDFDDIIFNAQSGLITRLSKDLQEKI